MTINIKLDDLTGKDIIDFLEEHIKDMKSVSPPESKHPLDLEGLKNPAVKFWTAWDDSELVACGALMKLSDTQGEIKSMRAKPTVRRTGVASLLLKHILDDAEKSGFTRVSLETGSMPFFKPAQHLYKKFGFIECEPFADYNHDPNSVFMSKDI